MEDIKPIAKKVILEPSYERLNTLHPKIRESAIKAYKEAVRLTPVGVHPVINEAMRSFERSDQLYAQGRTTKGPIVTMARAGQSLHNYGLAIDFYLEINKKAVWKVDKNWMIVVDCFKKQGFTWGGEFHSIPDYPHLEKTLNHTWQVCLALHNAGKIDRDGYILL